MIDQARRLPAARPFVPFAVRWMGEKYRVPGPAHARCDPDSSCPIIFIDDNVPIHGPHIEAVIANIAGR